MGNDTPYEKRSKNIQNKINKVMNFKAQDIKNYAKLRSQTRELTGSVIEDMKITHQLKKKGVPDLSPILEDSTKSHWRNRSVGPFPV